MNFANFCKHEYIDPEFAKPRSQVAHADLISDANFTFVNCHQLV